MGKSNIAVKQMLRNKAHFADLFNGTVFQGKQVIKPEELEEIDTEASIIMSDKKDKEKGVQKYRDITMRWKKEAELSILAVENQNKVHYAMPVRMMLYDGLSYTDQIRMLWQNQKKDEELTDEEFLSQFRKKDKIVPIIPLVFYYGLEKWDGSTDLYGMFQQSELFRSEETLKSYVPNYTLNLVDTGNIGDVKRFQTDLQLILGMLEYKENKSELSAYVNQHKDYFENVDQETYQAMRELMHSESKMKAVVKKSKRGEKVNMCKALDDLYNDGVQCGMAKGMEKGILALVKTCREFKLSQEDILERIVKEFSLAKEDALKYLEQ